MSKYFQAGHHTSSMKNQGVNDGNMLIDSNAGSPDRMSLSYSVSQSFNPSNKLSINTLCF